MSFSSFLTGHSWKWLVRCEEDDGVTIRHWSLAVKQPHFRRIYSRCVLKTSFSAPLKQSHLWWLNYLSGCLISWYVVCLLSSGPSFPVCLLLLALLKFSVDLLSFIYWAVHRRFGANPVRLVCILAPSNTINRYLSLIVLYLCFGE